MEYTDRVGELAKKHGLKLHIDGARIFNASVVCRMTEYLNSNNDKNIMHSP